jgi:hypothetical protein
MLGLLRRAASLLRRLLSGSRGRSTTRLPSAVEPCAPATAEVSGAARALAAAPDCAEVSAASRADTIALEPAEGEAAAVASGAVGAEPLAVPGEPEGTDEGPPLFEVDSPVATAVDVAGVSSGLDLGGSYQDDDLSQPAPSGGGRDPVAAAPTDLESPASAVSNEIVDSTGSGYAWDSGLNQPDDAAVNGDVAEGAADVGELAEDRPRQDGDEYEPAVAEVAIAGDRATGPDPATGASGISPAVGEPAPTVEGAATTSALDPPAVDSAVLEDANEEPVNAAACGAVPADGEADGAWASSSGSDGGRHGPSAKSAAVDDQSAIVAHGTGDSEAPTVDRAAADDAVLDAPPANDSASEYSSAGIAFAADDLGVDEHVDDIPPTRADSSDGPLDDVPIAEELAKDADAGDSGAGVTLPVAALMRRPEEYRPRLSRTRSRRAPATASSGGGEVQNLEADLQVLFGAGDWGIDVWALLRMPAAAADDVAILHDGVESWLGPLDYQLLEPLALADFTAALGEPLLVTAVDLPVRWSRSSRDIHVLGQHPGVAGFVSQARVVIGQENVVICRVGLVEKALAQILATDSPEPVRIEGPGVPNGWMCWRGVRPARPSLPTGGLAILDALDPLPAVKVELSGGVQLSRGVWLDGYPPLIRILGVLSEGDPVLIDSRTAVQDGDGAWTADGWDGAGTHRIEHGGMSAGYAIEAGASDWDWWAAWQGATPLAGALASADGGKYFHNDPSGTLIGARPGQICGFVPAASGIVLARPDFEPVWLLTAGSGRRRGTASQIGTPLPPGAPVGSKAAVALWTRAIGASGRAGAERSAERAMWARYVAAARSQRRRIR